jgi:hypothetical protein
VNGGRGEQGVGAEQRMIALGFGKHVRADRIVLIEPLEGDERGNGRRTHVWIEGVAKPVVASRSERAILIDMGELEPPPAAPARAPRRPPEPTLFD